MNALLQRTAAHRFKMAYAALGGAFAIWVEISGEKVKVECLGGEINDTGAAMQGMGFLRKTVSDMIAMVERSKLPEGYYPAEASRIWAAADGVLENAKSFKIDAVKSLSQLASHIQITGTKGK